MAEANRTGGPGARDAHILPGNGPDPSSGAGSGLLVDWEQLCRFRDLIGRGSEERLILTVFPPEQDQPNIHLPGDLGPAHRREAERTLRKHPQHGLGLVINPALPQPPTWGQAEEEKRKDGSPKTWGASNRHISGGLGIWAECDGGIPIEEQRRLPALAGLPEPTLTVWSGGRSLHLYWLIRERELLNHAQFRGLQQRAAAAIEAAAPAAKPDKGISNPARVMRAAGSRHPGKGGRCRIDKEGGPRYSIEELERLIPPLPSSASSSSSSSASSASSSGSAWFDRQTPERQREAAAEMLRHAPLRVAEKQGDYGECFRILAGLVHHFGPDDAAAICERAGWRSPLWDPIPKIPTIGASDQRAGIGTLISKAREGGWRHPLELEEERLADGFGIESPRPVVITEGEGGTSSSSSSRPEPVPPPSFAARWARLEQRAEELVSEGGPSVRLAVELGEAAGGLELKVGRGDLGGLLEAALRRLRPTSAPLLPGARFKVSPSRWAVEGLVRHGLNLLVGQSGAGKTRLALSLAAAWLRGDSEWLGQTLTGPASIEERELLILGTDQSRDDWAIVLEPLGLARDLGEGEMLLHPRITLHSLETGTLLDGDGLAMVRRWCDAHPGGMVVADSLAELLPPGIEEDKRAAARPVYALQDALGSCWGLLLHHTRKAAGKEGNLGVGAGRGSGAIDAAVSRVIGLGLLHKREGGQMVPQESDPRRELISTKRGGPPLHLIVSSDGSGAWRSEGSAADLKRAERLERAVANLTENQSAVLAALEAAAGERLTTRQLWEVQGKDWEADRSEGGAGAALLRKTLKRLADLGLVETVLQGKERLYRAASGAGIEEEPEGGEYESPERLADIREERIPQHVREERDADRLWEAQHRQRTEKEGELLDQTMQELEEAVNPPPVLTVVPPPEPAPLPLVGEEVEISDGRGGWNAGYRVEAVSSSEIRLISSATGKTLTKRITSRPSWRRPEAEQQLLLA